MTAIETLWTDLDTDRCRPTRHVIVTIQYTDGHREASAPLRRAYATWFAATMRAAHGDILSIEVSPCVS